MAGSCWLSSSEIARVHVLMQYITKIFRSRSRKTPTRSSVHQKQPDSDVAAGTCLRQGQFHAGGIGVVSVYLVYAFAT